MKIEHIWIAVGGAALFSLVAAAGLRAQSEPVQENVVKVEHYITIPILDPDALTSAVDLGATLHPETAGRQVARVLPSQLDMGKVEERVGFAWGGAISAVEIGHFEMGVRLVLAMNAMTSGRADEQKAMMDEIGVRLNQLGYDSALSGQAGKLGAAKSSGKEFADMQNAIFGAVASEHPGFAVSFVVGMGCTMVMIGVQNETPEVIFAGRQLLLQVVAAVAETAGEAPYMALARQLLAKTADSASIDSDAIMGYVKERFRQMGLTD